LRGDVGLLRTRNDTCLLRDESGTFRSGGTRRDVLLFFALLLFFLLLFFSFRLRRLNSFPFHTRKSARGLD
jgi:hypothetical protein